MLDRYIREAGKAGHPVRAVLFMDSDADRPGDCSREARQVRKRCEEASVPCRILRKRTIENYLPDAVFLAWREEKPEQVANLLRLTPEERDHYPVKKVFGDLPRLLNRNLQAVSAEGFRERDGKGELDGLVEMIVREI
ncbi:MAG: hypothetical protein HQM03_05285 [Magnetococcales bacterium]|nr:hypothetical protein [Magnetococcales bacterium]